MTLGEQIQKARRRIKLTQQGLANRAGLTLSTVQTIESGKHEPSVSTLFKLVRELRVPLEVEEGKGMVKVSYYQERG